MTNLSERPVKLKMIKEFQRAVDKKERKRLLELPDTKGINSKITIDELLSAIAEPAVKRPRRGKLETGPILPVRCVICRMDTKRVKIGQRWVHHW